MYEVYLERTAERDLKKLSPLHFKRVIRRLRALSTEPRPRGAHKIVGSGNDWRVRVGTYRIIYEVDDKARAVRIMRVKHRREAYR